MVPLLLPISFQIFSHLQAYLITNFGFEMLQEFQCRGESHFPPALQCSVGALFNHAIPSLVQTVHFIFYWRYHSFFLKKLIIL